MDKTYSLRATKDGQYDLDVLNDKGAPVVTAKGISFSEAVALIENDTYQTEAKKCGTSVISQN